MVKIKKDCRENAAGMLRSRATFLGWIGNIRYYVLDGKAWSINGAVVARSTNDEETRRIISDCKSLQQRSETY